MIRPTRLPLLAAVLALSFGASPVFAQDAAAPAPAPQATTLTDDPALIAVGAEVVRASNAARIFDELLPNIADRVKQTYIQTNPQMQLSIIEVVDKVAIDMVAKRADLDQKLAQIWATAFTGDELRTILEFYNSPAGQKFARVQPRVLAAQIAAGDMWSRIIGDEMMKQVKVQLDQKTGAEFKGLVGTEAPASLTAEPAAPAPAPQQ